MRHRFVLRNANVGFRGLVHAKRHLWVLLVWACRSAGGDAPTAASTPALSRGDHVVVEPRAAEFFEGRVLSIGKNQLRVEPVGKHEGISVSVSDVYSLKTNATAPKPGQYAICRIGERWLGCRIEHARADGVEVRSLGGEIVSIREGAVLAASPATELNLRRAFSKLTSSAAFAAAAANAGRPLAPAGFRLVAKARVVARRGAGWFSGVISEVHDDSAHVMFAPDNIREQIAQADIVPEPPASVAPGRGDFALVRPVSPAEPWQTMRVVGPEERDYKVVGADAVPRVVPARDVLPLAPAGGPRL
ncbi:MAG: hypothetical protein ACOY0T_40880 [Myxococcota bacterium]